MARSTKSPPKPRALIIMGVIMENQDILVILGVIRGNVGVISVLCWGYIGIILVLYRVLGSRL